MQIAGVELPDFALDMLQDLAESGQLDAYEGVSINSILQTTIGDDINAITIDWLPNVPHDIFYRAKTYNVLEYLGISIDDTISRIADIISAAGDIGLMMNPDTGNYYVKELEFEIYEDGSDPVMMIMAPVGQTGTMLNIALITQTGLKTGGQGTVSPVAGGKVIPPMPASFDETVGGVLLLTTSQVQGDNAEYKPSNTGSIGEIEDPHVWLQYMLPGDSTDIVPGEFVGIICQPWLPHCWWSQETSPFLYAGHWVETRFYSSGVVTGVLGDGFYSLVVKNEEIVVKSTDYYGYVVGERVGLLKTLTGTGLFSNKDMGTAGADWRLIPVDFYGATP